MSKDVQMVSQQAQSLAEIRRKNIEVLLQRYGSIAAVARFTGASPVYLSQVRNASKDGDKPRLLGDKLARRMEAELEIPAGWLDLPQWDDDAKAPVPGALESLPSKREMLGRLSSSNSATECVATSDEYKEEKRQNERGIEEILIELSEAIKRAPEAKQPLLYELVRQLGTGQLEDHVIAKFAGVIAQ